MGRFWENAPLFLEPLSDGGQGPCLPAHAIHFHFHFAQWPNIARSENNPPKCMPNHVVVGHHVARRKPIAVCTAFALPSSDEEELVSTQRGVYSNLAMSWFHGTCSRFAHSFFLGTEQTKHLSTWHNFCQVEREFVEFWCWWDARC